MEAQQTEPVKKGERTREHILNTALALFAERGYQQTSMRDIAASAECSLGLAYRYFTRKDEMVLALYARLLVAMDAQVEALPPAPLAERFDGVMRAKLAQLMPHRALLGAIAGAALVPDGDMAVLGVRSAEIRERASAIFRTVVIGASDAPRGEVANDLATLLYAAHLGLILFWLNDPTPNQRATDELLRFGRDALRLTRRTLRLPPVAAALGRLARAVAPVFRVEATGAN
jgi:AcrR family transcriptional regulator